ncbi:MAG: SpoIIE family protein phosphatase, partial [Candidatus Peregrinibacteria bacterium]|nr:SpoIIE family protein phosphatase [Candidatus Peregrinibacteria bacterium]
YLAEESFVYFNREVQGLFDKTQEVTGIGLSKYDGVILYDSSEEEARQYSGDDRYAPDEMVERIQATHPSYELESGRVVYVRTDENGDVDFFDREEVEVESIDPLDRVMNVIYPQGNRYAVLYSPSYDVLDQRIQDMWTKIILLTLFALLVGMTYAYFFSSGITRPLKTLQAGAIQIGAGDLKTRVEVKTHDEVGVLANTFNKMAEDLEKSVEAKLYKERVCKELELAAGIQKQILPSSMPIIAGLDIAAGLIPAAEVGGDVYDFFSPDDENFFGYVGDVTGHGVPAGLIVSIANALFHSYSHLKDPKQILISTNKILKAKTTANMFITLVLWHWNATTQKLTLVSAGHEVALKYSAGTVKTDELPRGGIALGMLPDITANLQEQPVELAKGDCIILYTDGVPEAWRNEKDQYGMPEFKRVVTQSCDLPSAEAIKIALLADVKQWSQGYEQKDDITVMVIKRA